MQNEENLSSLKRLTWVVYVLYALSYFTGITAIIGIIINYLKKDEVAETWIESHFRWQIRTFWFGLLWAVIGGATLYFTMIDFILSANFSNIIPSANFPNTIPSASFHNITPSASFSQIILILSGIFILSANFFWIIYRIVRGLLRLNENKTMTF